MCDIVGYVGPRKAAPLILEGLKRLEYRGYDSAGVAIKAGKDLIDVTVDDAKKSNKSDTFRGKSVLYGTQITTVE